jgi:hypothetical protein
LSLSLCVCQSLTGFLPAIALAKVFLSSEDLLLPDDEELEFLSVPFSLLYQGTPGPAPRATSCSPDPGTTGKKGGRRGRDTLQSIKRGKRRRAARA